MASSQGLVLKAFPQDGRIYRLDTVGHITMALARITPMVEVQLTPLRPGARPSWDPLDLDTDGTTFVTVSVGWHPILRAGSFWQNGRLRYSVPPSFQRVRFSIDTSHANMTLPHAWSKDRNGAWIIPPADLRIAPRMADTRLVLFKNVTGPASQLMIPCAETCRFYLTNSTPLASHTFSGAFILNGNDRVFDPVRSTWIDRDAGIYYVQLGMRIPDSDHLTVGRYAADRVANAEANGIVRNAIFARTNGGSYPIVFRVPFRDQTVVLDVVGIPLSNGRFLALQILRCNAQFPFAALEYGRDNDGRKGHEKPDTQAMRRAWELERRKTDPLYQQLYLEGYEEADPNAQDVPMDLAAFDPKDVYRLVPTRKTQKDSIESKSASITHNIGPPQSVSSGLQHGTSPHTSAQLVAKPDSKNDDRGARVIEYDPNGPGSLSYFRRMLAEMPATGKHDFQAIVSVHPYERSMLYPEVLGRRLSDWIYLDSRAEEKKARKVLAPRLLIHGKTFYLIEMERRVPDEMMCTIAVWQTSFDSLGETVFDEIFYALAQGRGVLKTEKLDDFGLSTYEFARITHPKADEAYGPERYAHRILNRLTFAAGLQQPKPRRPEAQEEAA